MQSISPFPSLAIAPAQLDVWDYIAAEEIPRRSCAGEKPIL
jgi:hypothetical protein